MKAPNRKEVNNSMERYQSLKLKESLTEPSRYALACKELSFILKNAFTKCPKILQSLIFQDCLFAFSLLPSLQSMSAISAADSLLRSVEVVLPKQKRALAVAEYKHAVVASKRKLKGNHEKRELTPLPRDVLVHIFSFLDLRSLVSASAVCWFWNAAANDNCLWKSLYIILVGQKTYGATDNEGNIDWRHAFKTAYKDNRCKKFKYCRGYCWSCRSVVWLNNGRCCNTHTIIDPSNHQSEPVSTPQQIVEYILDGALPIDSSSDSDSDGEDASVHRLWAYPRQIRQ